MCRSAIRLGSSLSDMFKVGMIGFSNITPHHDTSAFKSWGISLIAFYAARARPSFQGENLDLSLSITLAIASVPIRCPHLTTASMLGCVPVQVFDAEQDDEHGFLHS